ncbi:hypothetical protein J6590_046086 [Homalodisca vitripennis]|nr:hypothetical protein J6590_046086 [Homalodisca vitripennis]
MTGENSSFFNFTSKWRKIKMGIQMKHHNKTMVKLSHLFHGIALRSCPDLVHCLDSAHPVKSTDAIKNTVSDLTQQTAAQLLMPVLQELSKITVLLQPSHAHSPCLDSFVSLRGIAAQSEIDVMNSFISFITMTLTLSLFRKLTFFLRFLYPFQIMLFIIPVCQFNLVLFYLVELLVFVVEFRTATKHVDWGLKFLQEEERQRHRLRRPLQRSRFPADRGGFQLQSNKGPSTLWTISEGLPRTLRLQKLVHRPLVGRQDLVYLPQDKAETFVDAMEQQFLPNPGVEDPSRDNSDHLVAFIREGSDDENAGEFPPVSRLEVATFISRLRSRKAAGPDNLSSAALKRLSEWELH